MVWRLLGFDSLGLDPTHLHLFVGARFHPARFAAHRRPLRRDTRRKQADKTWPGPPAFTMAMVALYAAALLASRIATSGAVVSNTELWQEVGNGCPQPTWQVGWFANAAAFRARVADFGFTSRYPPPPLPHRRTLFRTFFVAVSYRHVSWRLSLPWFTTATLLNSTGRA